MKENIKKHLDKYLEKETNQAILLTGKWGCGKTYFIKNYYMETHKSNENYKFIYISLFGLKNISDIELYPSILNKILEFLNNTIDDTDTKIIGIRINIKYLILELINFFKKINPIKKIKPKKIDKKVIFILDDLERTSIEIQELLGFINFLTETRNEKVILIANEEELIEKNQEMFNKFKEKTITKTILLEDISSQYFYSTIENKLAHIKIDINVVKYLFEQYGNKNYRIFNTVIDDYLDLIKEIKEEYLINDNFLIALTNNYLFCAFNYKIGNNWNEIKSKSKKIPKEENSIINFNAVPVSFFENIITDILYDKEQLNNNISEFYFFQKHKSWQILFEADSYHRNISSDEFYESLNDIIKKFKRFEYDNIFEIAHVVRLLVPLIENNFTTELSIHSIKI